MLGLIWLRRGVGLAGGGRRLTRSGVVGSMWPHEEVTVVGVSGTGGGGDTMDGMAKKLLMDLRTAGVTPAACFSSRVDFSSVTSLGSSRLNRPITPVSCLSSLSKPSLLLL